MEFVRVRKCRFPFRFITQQEASCKTVLNVDHVPSSAVKRVMFGRAEGSNHCYNIWTLNMLKVSENRAMERIFRPEREEVIGGCRKLHTEEHCNL
jgi:hypothetical protein